MTETNTEAARISPDLKRRGSAKKMPQAKRHRRKSPSSVKTPASTVAMQWEEEVRRLDPEDEVQANRLQQRRKTILKGKNTAGYDRYLEQVPKNKRVPRSMDTPSTPDPSLDISTKRWQGQVRAWRVSLHKYDPPELMNSATALGEDSIVLETPSKAVTSLTSEEADSPLSVMSETSRRDLDQEFAASAHPMLRTGAIGWGDDSSSDEDDDDLL